MTDRTPCLNCGAGLDGPFCAQCGQRAVPPYPTIHEYAGDAWEDFSGWDGRFARTLRLLFGRPGQLTTKSLEGRRQHYVKPMRLYLGASLLYFVVAAAAPNVGRTTEAVVPGKDRVTINLADGRGVAQLTEEQRRQVQENVADAPAWLKPLFTAVLEDPIGFRNRVLTALPKMIFCLVPAFALILSVFYRRRPFMQHLTFALHLHAVIFLILTVPQLASFTRSPAIVGSLSAIGALFLVYYVLRALRTVYGGGWVRTLVNAVGTAILYFMLWVPGMIAVLAWASLAR